MKRHASLCGGCGMSAILSALLFLAWTPPATAQNTAALTGAVTDSSGAVIPAATIRITRQQTGAVTEIQTSASGVYLAAALEVGTYTIEVAADGFKTFRRSGIVLNVRDRVRVDVELELGQVTEVIEVTQQFVALQTENAVVGEVVSGEQVESLAMNGRNFMQLAALVPGAANINAGGFNTPTGVSSGAAGSISFNGMRQNHNVWRVDGQENYDRGCGGCVEVLPSIDAIEEFKVSTASAEVDAGFGAGGQINVAIKSGTQDFHGTFYEFLRNDELDATNFFLNRGGQDKQKLRFNNFGFNVGGPISFGGYNRDKTKTFFFYNQEWRRIRQDRVFDVVTPSVALRGGDFSQESRTITDPETGLPFANNVIPQSRIDPNAAILADPNLVIPAPTSGRNFVGVGGEPINVHQEILRVDHNVSERNRVFFRFIFDTNTQTFATTQWSNQSFPTIGTDFSNNPKKFYGQWTSTISPNVINEFSAGFSNQPLALNPIGNFARPAGLSIPELFPDNRANRLPNLIFEGNFGVNINNGSWPWTNDLETWQFRNNTLWNRGNHTIRFGGEFMPLRKIQDFFGPTQGEFRFRTAGTGDEFASFLLGRADRFIELEEQKSPNFKTRSGGLWVSDTWRAHDRLTLNFALRYDMLPPSFVDSDELAAFFPRLFNSAAAPVIRADGQIEPGTGDRLNGMAIAGQDGFNRGLVNKHSDLFAPRVGLAWRMFGGDTVLRLGYGIFYERIQGNYIFDTAPNIPFSSTPAIFSTGLSNPGGGTSAIFPANIRTADQRFEIPQIQNWNVGIQHRLSRGMVANIGYVGSASSNLQTVRELNQPSLADAARVKAGEVNVDAARPFPGFSSILQFDNSTNSNYHSLQASLRAEDFHGLTLQTSYTWSKAIDVTSGDVGGLKHQNSFDTSAERGPSDFDRTNMLVVSYVYDVPTPAAWQNSGLRHVFGGWTLSGITTIQTGTPRNIIASGDPVGLGNCGPCRPNVLNGDVSIDESDRTVDRFFNTNLFSDAPAVVPGTFGNAGRNVLRGPGPNNWDLSAFKNFSFNERIRLQFRAEFFNIFNHTQFNDVVTDVNNERFGQVTSTRAPRTIQLGLKLHW